MMFFVILAKKRQVASNKSFATKKLLRDTVVGRLSSVIATLDMTRSE
jgi:hypothetical protein